MDIIYDVCCNIYCALKAESDVCTPDIVVYGLRKRDDVHSGVHKEFRALLGTVSSHYQETVKIQTVISILHGRDQTLPVLIYYILSGNIILAGCSEDRPSLSDDT